MRLLPSTRSQLLSWTLLALVVACAWFTLRGVLLAISGPPQWLFAASLFPLLGLGLWLRQHIARIFALLMLWFVVIVVPLVMFNPFAALDGAYGPNSPPAGTIILQPMPWVVASLFAIYVLGKYKHEFRWWRRPAA
jgi:hypothetical protein